MKKKKAMALILAAAMTISTIGQTTGIYAADFTDGEAAVQETVSEDADAFAAGTKEEAPDTEEPAEVFTEAEPEELFADDAEPERADDTAVVAYGEDTSRANYSGAYVTEEQFMHWKETREEPEGDWVTTRVETTPTDFFKALSGENTGYCLVTVDGESEGYADLNVPDGLTVGLVEHAEVNLRSISGKAVLNGGINTPGTLQIDGEVETAGVDIRGTVFGAGSNDTVILSDWAQVEGILKVENMIFINDSLNIKGGQSEFYNISVENRNDDNHNVHLFMEGYSDKVIPVLHNNYDLGVNKGTDDQGNPQEWPAGVGVHYVKNWEAEEWEFIDPGLGKTVMKFSGVSDVDIMDMVSKNWVGGLEHGYAIDLDGKTCTDDWDQLYPVRRYKSGGGMTAQEVFEADGRGDWPWEECQEDICALPSLSQASRAIAAYEKSGKGEGYYFVELPRGGKITETLTVPEGAAGVKYWARNDWNEETEINTPVPMSVSKINAPEGKVVSLGNAFVPSGNITVSGTGTVEFMDCDLGGIIQGSLSQNNMVLLKDGIIGGIKDVKNLVVDNWGFNVRGNVCEIHNISKTERAKHNDDGTLNLDVNINIEGTKTQVVLHEDYDLGVYEEEWGPNPARIGVNFIKDMSIDGEWECIDPGEGAQIFKFDMPDKDAVKLLDKVGFWGGDESMNYRIDIDGTMFYGDTEDKTYPMIRIEKFVDCDGISAEELFYNQGHGEMPEGFLQWAAETANLKNAARIMNAVEENGEGQDYYQLRLPKDFTAKDTITVPDKVKGILLESDGLYDEATDTFTRYSASISSVNVPEGKSIRLLNLINTASALNITGKGTAELLGCRLNQNVTAEGTVNVMDTTVKSLVCDKLICSREYARIAVGKYLKFNSASFSGPVIYALPGAYLDFGSIDNTALVQHDFVNVFLGAEGSKKAELSVSGKLDLGKVTWEDGESPGYLYAGFCDVAAAKKEGASFTQDCYSGDYHFDGEEGKHFWGDFLCEYGGEDICLLTMSRAVAEESEMIPIIAGFSNASMWLRKNASGIFDPADEGIDGNKYLTFYHTEEGPVKAPAYFLVGDSKGYLGNATVSTIKDQTYTGKALKPSVTVKLNGKTLKNGTDYTVSYKNNTKVGTATVTITGKGNYTGTITKTFKIVQPVPAKGKTFTVGTLKYKVTKSAASNGTVTVSAPVKKTYTSVTIPSTVKINGYTFKVTAIADSAFKSNTKLKTVKIGSYVTTIGKQAFYGCKALKSITINSKVLKTVGSSAFKGIYAKATIKVPSANLKAYTKLLKGKGQASTVKITK